MISLRDTLASLSFSRRRAEALAHLRAEMEKLGMHEADGWHIVETTRQVADGSELVMRPLHMHLPTPEGLECVVHIDEIGSTVEAHCEP